MAPSLSFGSRPISSSISVASIFISVLILTFGIVTLNSLVPFRDLVGPVLSSHHDHIGSSSGGSSGGSSGSLLATSSRLTLFTEHHEYKNMSHEHDYLWQELLGPNGGFLKKVDQDKKFHSYGISMFHQLHCLQMIRGAVQGLLEENAMTRMNHSEKTERETMDEHEHEHEHDHATGSGGDDPHKGHLDSRHWLHCFDYLRQV
ncbi:hypothetical protein B0T17DRAFT_595893 [Bombardia bombarda]|uniref:Uncharacterized protein n=1 Tax=Bombardia bombarda TaxID=252184 RepID=A0AA39XLS9_9PEZI|nr:hypothetical protein B0T17DRAFT_595893 [Bombardia bombarda]